MEHGQGVAEHEWGGVECDPNSGSLKSLTSPFDASLERFKM